MNRVIVIRREDPTADDTRALLADGDAYYAGLYPPESNHLLDPASLQRSNVGFFVARMDGEAVGCGACVLRDGYAEIKRMWVKPAARGTGLGRRILGKLEVFARTTGMTILRLETGIKQPEALSLYASAGYADTAPFGDYKPDPYSRFMEKRLP